MYCENCWEWGDVTKGEAPVGTATVKVGKQGDKVITSCTWHEGNIKCWETSRAMTKALVMTMTKVTRYKLSEARTMLRNIGEWGDSYKVEL